MSDEAVERQLREQLLDAFADADFPVEDQMDLVPALPDGPTTTFEAGDRSFSAMELAANLGAHQDFPYATAEELVDDVIGAMREEGML
ncbi:MAG: MTH865 family protein [Haloferacaceae archaeon]